MLCDSFRRFWPRFHAKFQATQSVWVSAPLSAVAGLAMAFVTFLLFKWMFKQTESSSESRVASLVGQEASIITPIPENGVGEIAYIQGDPAIPPRRGLKAALRFPPASPFALPASSAHSITLML